MKTSKVLLICLGAFLLSCSKETKQPLNQKKAESKCNVQDALVRGDRILGVDILNTTENNTFEQNISLAKALGLGFISLHM